MTTENDKDRPKINVNFGNSLNINSNTIGEGTGIKPNINFSVTTETDLDDEIKIEGMVPSDISEDEIPIIGESLPNEIIIDDSLDEIPIEGNLNVPSEVVIEDNLDDDDYIVFEGTDKKITLDNVSTAFNLGRFLSIESSEDKIEEDDFTDDAIVSEDGESSVEESEEVQDTAKKSNSVRLRRLERHRKLSTALATAITEYQEKFKEADLTISAYSKSVNLGIQQSTVNTKSVVNRFKFNGMPKVLNDNLPNIWGYMQQIRSTKKEIDISKIMKTPLGEISKRASTYSSLSLNEVLPNVYEETLAINLLTAIKESIDDSYQQATENKIKHDSIVEKCKKRYFQDLNGIKTLVMMLNEENTVMVENVDSRLEKYVCGNPECTSEFIKAEYPLALFSTLGVKNGVVSLFSPNLCPNCGKFNIMSSEEVKRLDLAYRNGKDEIFAQLVDFMSGKTSGYACSLYGLPSDIVDSEIPNIAETVESSRDIEIDNVDFSDCYEAIERYISLLDFFYSSEVETGSMLRISEEVTSAIRNIEHQLEQEPSGEFVIDDSLDEIAQTEEQEEETIGEDEQPNLHTVDKTYKFYGTVSKLMACAVSKDYNLLKSNAINSLIYHFERTVYGQYLKSSPKLYLEGLYKSKGIVNVLRKMDESHSRILLKDIVVAFKSYDIDVDTSLEGESLYEHLDTLFESLVPKIKEFETLRDYYISKVENKHLQLSTLYIGNFSVDKNIITDYITNPEVARLVDLISDTMVISSVAEDYYYLLFSGLNDKDISKLKDFVGTSSAYFKKIADYVVKNRIVTGMTSPRVLDSINFDEYSVLPYPDLDLSSVLRLYPKLQIYLNKDEYRTIGILVEILSKFDYDEEKDIALKEHKLNNFKVFKDIWRIKGKLNDIIGKYDSDECGRLLYYFGDLFTEEEIRNANVDYDGDISVIYKKEENETFESYMELYSNVSDKGKDREFKVVKTANTDLLERIAVDLDAVGMLYNTFQDAEYVKNVNIFVFVLNFMFILNKFLDLDASLNLLNFNDVVRNFLLSSLPKLDISNKINTQFVSEVSILSFIYSDPDINAYVLYERDVELIDSNGNVSDVSISNIEDRMAMLSKDFTTLLDSAEHIPKADKEILNEYFGSRE